MKTVILDGYTENPGGLGWDGFEKLGKLTVYNRAVNSMEIVERIGDAQVAYTNKTPITKKITESCRNLKYTDVLATGCNVVGVRAAKEAGVIVTNIPTCGSDAISQFAIALLLELYHHIGEYTEYVKSGDWTSNPDWCFWNHPLAELIEKAMGVIEFGRIGQGTGRTTQALGMKILVYNTCKNKPSESAACRYTEMDELLVVSDVTPLHHPSLPETRGIISGESIAKMKDRVTIINNSKGQLIMEEDSRDALDNGKMAETTVDVVPIGPIRTDNPLLMVNSRIITPHISWASEEFRQRPVDVVVDNLKVYVNGKPVNVINE